MASYNPAYSQFKQIFIPLVLLSKLIRYTIMYERLVEMGIGWFLVNSINNGNHHFAISGLSIDNYAGSPASNNVIALCETVNVFGIIDTYYGWEALITIVFNIIVYCITVKYLKTHPFITKFETYFIYLNVIVLNLFSFCLAKEFFQMIFWIITMLAIKKNKSNIQGVIKVAFALALTVLFTRKYYGIVFVDFVILQFYINNVFSTLTSQTSKLKIAFYVISFIVVATVIYYAMSLVLLMEAEDTYSELERVNSTARGDDDTSSMINPIFNGSSPTILTLEYFIKIFRLMFPVELLMHFKVTYVITIIFQGMLFYILVNNLIHRKQCSVENKLATDLYIAFWLTSAAFEPDFGSWMRHQSVVLPVMLYMLGGNSFVMVLQGNQRIIMKSC